LDGKSLPSGDELSEQSRASDASAWLLGDWLGLAPPTDALDVARWQPPERDVVPAVRRHLFLQVLLT